MRFIVEKDPYTNVVDVSLDPDTKKTLIWNASLGVIGVAGIIYLKKNW